MAPQNDLCMAPAQQQQPFTLSPPFDHYTSLAPMSKQPLDPVGPCEHWGWILPQDVMLIILPIIPDMNHPGPRPLA